MKRFLAVGFCVAGMAAAQTKISGAGKCGNADQQQSAEVGDRPGHMLALMHQTCTWTSPIEMAGVKSKSYTGTIVSDISGQKASDRGYVVVLMENGDKAFVRIDRGTTTIGKDGKPESGEGTWTYIGGTGKFRGLKGKGTYKGKPLGDGYEDQIEGEYVLPAAK